MDVPETLKLIHCEEQEKCLKGIRRNLAVLCVIWVFTFTAYSCLQNLEASLNQDIGVYSLACITGGGMITCLIAPAIFKYIGCKGAFVFSWISFIIFIGANFYPKTYSLLPASVIIGLSTGLLWTGQGIFVTTSALEYSRNSKQSFEVVLTKFFGIFGMAFQSTQIWGNLISSLVLQSNSERNTTEKDLNYCGSKDCNNGINQTSSVSKPDDDVVYTLLGILIGCVVIGLFLTIVFLKPIKIPGDSLTSDLKTLMTSTSRLLLMDANMAMLVPVSLFLGVEQVLIYAEFTKSYVTCALGIDWVGYTMICFGVCDTIGSPFMGWVSRYVGRGFFFLCAAALNISLLAVMLVWQLSPSNLVIFFMIPALWGLADAVWQTQTAALVGAVFPDKQEPAFANYRMFQAFGFTIAYVYSNFLCQYIKLYMIGGLLLVSLCLIGVVERRHKSRTKSVYTFVYDG